MHMFLIPPPALSKAAAGHVLRYPLCFPYARFRLARSYRCFAMTASPSNPRLWDPSRGISFSPAPRPPTDPAHVSGPRALSSDARTVPWETSSLPEDREQAEAASAAAETDEVGPAAKAEADAPKGGALAAEPVHDPPYPALPWKLSEDLFRAAKSAAPGTPDSFWSYKLYRGPGNEVIKVHYCRSQHTAERVCKEYFMDEKVLGFDLEWAPDATRFSGPRRNVSLIQLASPSRIALFHVAIFPKTDNLVPPSFRKVMENVDVTKVGVWIKGDAKKLQNHLGVESRGLVELSHLYRLVTFSKTGEYQHINRKLIPLATHVQDYLHLPMFKGQDVRASDWTKILRADQVTYSASDAYAGVQLYATLEHHRKQLNPCPPHPHFAETGLPIRLTDGCELNTDSEEDVLEAEDGLSVSLSVTARKRLLRAHLKSAGPKSRKGPKYISEDDTQAPPETPKETDPRIEAAEAWAEAFQRENQPAAGGNYKTVYATRPELRAYHVWHTNKDLSLEEVAELLRDPPYALATITAYIRRAVTKERLPVDGSRYLAEIAPRVVGKPPAVLQPQEAF